MTDTSALSEHKGEDFIGDILVRKGCFVLQGYARWSSAWNVEHDAKRPRLGRY